MKNIKYLLLVVFFCISIQAQENNQQKAQYGIIPSTDVMLMVASQTDCPLQLENVRLLYKLDTKQIAYQWDIRNRGAKPIASFLIDAWWADGTGGSLINLSRVILTNSLTNKNEVLMPGEFIRDDLDEKQIVPLTKELREQLKFSAEMKTFIILVVRYANFSDGTQYNGVSASNALAKFLEKNKVRIDGQKP